jgi:uncharacterized membrane protein YhaH (DUF805 family)
MVEAVKKFFNNYANFNGRSTRADYWWVVLASACFGFVVGFIGGLMGESGIKIISTIMGLYSLAILVPSLAITVRRLHDTNKSGWFILISLVPFVGSIILLVFLCLDSVNEGNQYGEVVQ